ncbi:MAG: pilus assembly PilX N-terminal domain-containing protein [Candidatus Omnitrophota bacterium]|nr:MAG: pilus assembly PilX N-terminal domain-containing protein [Candidatus Omnitrophota bacterium]
MRKGFALIVTIIVITLLSALGIFGVSMLSADMQIATEAMQSAEAFYIAEAGLQRVMGKLNSDPDYRDAPTTLMDTLGEGMFSVMVSKDAYTYTLNSTATVGDVTRKIQQSAIVFQQAPEAFNYGIYCYGDIFMNTVDMTINGSIATEGEIYQFATNLNLNGDLVEHLSANNLEVDIHSYEAIADYVYDGTQNFSDTTINGIYYVKGDVIIQNQVTINGSIISEGTITLNITNSTITSSGDYPTFASEDDIVFNSAEASTMSGLIYASDDVRFNNVQNTDFTGSIVGADDVEFNSCYNFNLNFDSEILIDPPPYFSDSESGVWRAAPQPDWDEQ